MYLIEKAKKRKRKCSLMLDKAYEILNKIYNFIKYNIIQAKNLIKTAYNYSKKIYLKADKFLDKVRSNDTARRTILAVCMVVFIYSMFNIISTLIDYRRSKNIYDDIRTKYRNQQSIDAEQSSPAGSLPENMPEDTVSRENIPSPQSSPAAVINEGQTQHNDALPQDNNQQAGSEQQKLEFKGLDEIKKINQDVAGWISITGTNIDYPVLQGKDNDFYLKHNIYKEKSRAASIFMDYRNDPTFEDQNTILYGHNMKDGSMFRDLLYYEQPWFFKKHKIINIETAKGTLKYEVFSVYVTDVNFNYLITNFNSEKEYEDFLNVLKEKSKVKSDAKVSAKDKILTLSTCSYQFKNARTVVHAKRVLR